MTNILDAILQPMTETNRLQIMKRIQELNQSNVLLGKLTLSSKIGNLAACLSKAGLASISQRAEWDALAYSSSAHNNLTGLLSNPTIAIYTQGVIMVTYAILIEGEIERLQEY